MATLSAGTQSSLLSDQHVAIVGRLASMAKRDAQQLIRQHGGTPVELGESEPQLVVVGENLEIAAESGAADLFDEATRTAIDAGRCEVIGESQFWQRLGLVDDEQDVRRLYTPAMLAELIGVPVAVVRRWHRRGLIKPVREVRKLPYFDFEEVATARRLAELLAAGVSPAVIERRLAELAKFVPGVERPLAQLSVIVRGSRLLLRQGDGLVAPGGQMFFDFDAAPTDDNSSAATEPRQTISLAEVLRSNERPMSPEEMLDLAADMEDEGNFAAAVEVYRTHAAAAGPTPPVCFAMAELLYRIGDSAGARERYYMALELDEDYVEARANLGCVLAEMGDRELAVAAFQGALAQHPEYADVHFHLARTLDELNRFDEAKAHWQKFVGLAPESPWAETARQRLSESD